MPPEIPPAQEPPLFVALRRADDRAEPGESADGDVAVVLDRRLESLEKARKRAEGHGQTIPASSAFVLELRWCP